MIIRLVRACLVYQLKQELQSQAAHMEACPHPFFPFSS